VPAADHAAPLSGVSEKDLAVGEAIAVKLYENDNPAEISVTKGAK
jgi:hypothetical protein